MTRRRRTTPPERHEGTESDWGGKLWAVYTRKGSKAWGCKFTGYGLSATKRPRTTPAVVDGLANVGRREGACLLVIGAADGNLLWKTQLDTDDPFAIVTTSPAVQGAASWRSTPLAPGARLALRLHRQREQNWKRSRRGSTHCRRKRRRRH